MYRCGKCGQSGHNSRTCGKTPAFASPPNKTTVPGKPPVVNTQEVSSTETSSASTPVMETMTTEEIQTWWTLMSGKTGRQKSVEKTYKPFWGTRTYNYRKNEVEWEQSDTDQLISMVDTAVKQNASLRALKKFLTTFGAHAKTELARSSKPLPAQVCLILAKDPSARVREALAEKENLPEPICRILADDKRPAVRVRLAGNSTVPAPVLQKLFDERKTKPRAQNPVWGSEGELEDALARNQHTPAGVIRNLLGTNEKTTKGFALSHPHISIRDVTDVWNNCRHDLSQNPEICYAIVSKDVTPAHILIEYSEHVLGKETISRQDGFALIAIAQHPHTPTETLRMIREKAIDKDKKVDPYRIYRLGERLVKTIDEELKARGKNDELSEREPYF